MANADFDIQFFDGKVDGDVTLFQPGEALKGRVTIYTDSDINCKQVTARLRWQTEGRGTQYVETPAEMQLHEGSLKAGLPAIFEFAFTLPSDPWSYEGYYVSIVWTVQIDLNVAWGKDIVGSKRFLLRPVPSEES